MIEILEFIFQDFWHWLGTLILVAAIPVPFGEIRTLLRIGRSRKKVKRKFNFKKNRYEY